ncbi:MAG: hypothetical protein KatS3mg112_0780 [Thermogutta sp.]|nr:MAG: hypothetical protein KatS3mg112_0780 [Thermogutta sp.]
MAPGAGPAVNPAITQKTPADRQNIPRRSIFPFRVMGVCFSICNLLRQQSCWCFVKWMWLARYVTPQNPLRVRLYPRPIVCSERTVEAPNPVNPNSRSTGDTILSIQVLKAIMSSWAMKIRSPGRI